MKKITINEHNEAFLFLFQYLLQNRNDYLFIHIDEHHDLSSPIFLKSEYEYLSSCILYPDNIQMDLLRDITYRSICNSDFIIPLYHFGLLEKTIWINNKSESHVLYINTDSEQVSKDKIRIYAHTNEKTTKNAYLSTQNIDYIDGVNRKLIVSVDLDYFSKNDLDGESVEISITEEQYNEITKIKQNKLWLLFGRKIAPIKRNDKFILSYNLYDGKYDDILIEDKGKIATKIKKIGSFLNKHRKDIDLLIICKSSISGFTNQKYLAFIYSQLLSEFYEE